MNEMMNGMFGKVAAGMCRLSMYGGIAIKTESGYKSYDAVSGRLVNCENFVFPVGEEFFFVIPTNKVKKGDIILANGKPKYVLAAEKNKITALNYENAVVEMILPERFFFMGNTYFYGKIVSMFGSKGLGGQKGAGRIMKYMMLSQMLKGDGNKSLFPMLMLAGKGDMGFEDLFEFEEGNEPEETDDIEE